MKFVWLEIPDGGRVPVNPDQVQYLRQGRGGGTELVFGALQGGFHTLAVAGDGESVTAALEAAGASPERTAPAAPEPPPADRAARPAGRGRRDTPPPPAPPGEPA